MIVWGNCICMWHVFAFRSDYMFLYVNLHEYMYIIKWCLNDYNNLSIANKSFPTTKNGRYFSIYPYRIGLRWIRTDAVGSQHTCGRAERTPAVSGGCYCRGGFGNSKAPGCVFFGCFFWGGEEWRRWMFFFQRMGSFSEKSKKINNGFQKEWGVNPWIDMNKNIETCFDGLNALG